MGTIANVKIGTGSVWAESGAAATIHAATVDVNDDVGFILDGVEFIYSPDMEDIDVDGETVPINRIIIKEAIGLKANLAEATVTNLELGLAGGVLTGGDTVTFGTTDGSQRHSLEPTNMQVKFVGVGPSSTVRTITLYRCSMNASVSIPYKKGGVNVVPVEFHAMLPMAGSTGVATIIDV